MTLTANSCQSINQNTFI